MTTKPSYEVVTHYCPRARQWAAEVFLRVDGLPVRAFVTEWEDEEDIALEDAFLFLDVGAEDIPDDAEALEPAA